MRRLTTRCMTAILSLLFSLITENIFAQTKSNLSAPKPSNSKGPVINASQPAVNISAGEMMSIANSTSATDLTSWNNKIVDGSVGVNQNSETLKKYAEERVAKEVYGHDGPSEIGITYTSQPVALAYNKYIAPNIEVFMGLNEEIYDGKFFKKLIAAKVAELVVNAALKNNAYTTPGSVDKLKAELHIEFDNDEFPKESETAAYYEGRLYRVYNKTAMYLNDCGIGASMSCKNDRTNSFFFMSNPSMKNICAIAAIVGRSNINTIKNQSNLTKGLYAAKWGTMFRPLTSYMNQASAFDIYVTNVKKIQEMTAKGSLYTLYDTDNKSVSGFAFWPSISTKVRTATVFNTLK